MAFGVDPSSALEAPGDVLEVYHEALPQGASRSTCIQRPDVNLKMNILVLSSEYDSILAHLPR